MLLQDFGYTVITAVDGEDAVNKFTENKDRIQLLLFDLIMPGKSGKDAYDEIRLVRPDIKVIFASGYDPDMVRQKALLEQNVPVVYKPVPMAVLLKKIRVVLDGAGVGMGEGEASDREGVAMRGSPILARLKNGFRRLKLRNRND